MSRRSRMKLLAWFVFLWALSVSDGRKSCSTGSYWDFGLDKCDLCSSICDFKEQQGTVKACQESCPDYKSKSPVKSSNRQPIDDNDTNVIVTLCVCVTVGAIFSLVLAGFLLRRRRQRNTDVPSDEPTQQQSPLPHSSVAYVALRVHSQCEDPATSGLSAGVSTDRQEEVQENLMGYPDLPDRTLPMGDDSSLSLHGHDL